MIYRGVAATVIAVSVLAGVFLSTGVPELSEDLTTGDSRNSTNLEYGSAHDHALFYVYANGSELDFTAERYQLNSRYVHLENNRSHIVHKHAEGVTWQKFLGTLNISLEQDGQECLQMPGKRFCGNSTVMLNGEPRNSLSTEIEQGDRLAIVFGNKSVSIAREYMKKQLPRDYKPEASRGRRV